MPSKENPPQLKSTEERLKEILQGRIVLDYPLDLLLDRCCRLNVYESGVVARMREFETKRGRGEVESSHTATAELREAESALAAALAEDNRDSPCYRSNSPLREHDHSEIGSLRFPSQSTDSDVGVTRNDSEATRNRTAPLNSAASDAKNTESSPKKPTSGSGNFLILGRPGSGKSTLSLQFAIAATSLPNKYSSLFVSLEESPTQILEKCSDFGWTESLGEERGNEPRVRELCFCEVLDDAASPAMLATAVRRAITRPRRGCPLCPEFTPAKGAAPRALCVAHHPEVPSHPSLFIAALPPKAPKEEAQVSTFWERFKQLDRLLTGFGHLREENAETRIPELRLVCVDGLSAFGDAPLSREELRKLLDLFQRHGVIGVLTAEQDAPGEVAEMEYLADVVVRLYGEEDAGYFVRHLEITKSRHQQQVNGRHPYRIRRPTVQQRGKAELFQAFLVSPSIHYISHSTKLDQGARPISPSGFDIGVPGLAGILPDSLTRPTVVTIRGKSGTYKSSIAQNFLMRGLCEGQNGLLLTLGERPGFTGPNVNWILHEPAPGHLDPHIDTKAFSRFDEKGQWLDDNKLCRRVWRYDGAIASRIPGPGHIPDPAHTPAFLVEIAFKQGALHPEEFLEYVRDVWRLSPFGGFRRVVLDDVSLVGTSYPLLRHSRTAGDLCLSTFVHLVRAKDANLIMAGTPGNFAEADEMVNRACTLSDSVLSCDFCDIFGQRFVLLTGEGLMSERDGASRSPSARAHEPAIPGVIHVDSSSNRRSFCVDREKLRGLVGYDKGNIHRPGLVLNVFSEGAILQGYNDEIATMLDRACASDISSQRETRSLLEHEPPLVTVHKYGSDRSEAIHDSLRIQGGKPVDKTVIVAFDEFFGASSDDGEKSKSALLEKALAVVNVADEGHGKKDKAPLHSYLSMQGSAADRLVPYYANVLVLAYNTDVVTELSSSPTWQEILDCATGLKTRTPRHPPSSGTGRRWEKLIESAFTRPLIEDASRPPALWPFEVGAWSTETLACILLDALVAGLGKPECRMNLTETDLFDPQKVHTADSERGQAVRKLLLTTHDDAGRDGLGKALTPLAKLFKLCWRYWELGIAPAHRKQIESVLEKKLVPNAAFYVCWYSQLRELIEEHPQLAKKLKVLALPGGGFKGDWFLGVVNGSVSVSLGEDVLRTLCHRDEDHKRFLRGVGLPVGQRYCEQRDRKYVGDSFLAWPRACEDLKLVSLIKIHQRALSRSHIPGYERFHGMLGNLGRQLAFSGEKEIAADVKDCINRLRSVVEFSTDKLVLPLARAAEVHRTAD